MPTLFLVRHGQASFGSDDYDRLSSLGHQQCVRLGRYWAEREQHFAAVLRGTLKRHQQSLAGLREGHGALPEATLWPGLNEYDSHAVIRSVHSGELVAPRSPEEYRHHFRLLREGLTRWIAGELQPTGMPSWQGWLEGIAQALDHVRSQAEGDVLLVSSGGPIATAVAQVLGAPPEAMVELNLRLRNSAVTEFAFTPKRHMLHSFNHLPHLDGREWKEWVTYT
jgi:broad specificity phosphatase PhoE